MNIKIVLKYVEYNSFFYAKQKNDYGASMSLIDVTSFGLYQQFGNVWYSLLKIIKMKRHKVIKWYFSEQVDASWNLMSVL